MDNKQPEQPQVDTRPPRATEKEEYDDAPTPTRSAGRGFNGGISGLFENSWIRALVVGIVIVLFVQVFSLPKLVSKSDFETNILGISSTVNQATASINEAKTQLDAAVQAIPTQITNIVTEKLDTKLTNITNTVNTAASKVESYDTTIQNLKNNSTTALSGLAEANQKLTDFNKTLNDKLTEQTDLITALTKRVETLEAVKTEEQTNPTSPVVVTVKQQNTYLNVNTTEDVSWGVVRLTIENTSNKPVEDVVIGLYFNSSTLPTTGTVLGGTLGWVPSQYSALYYRSGGWGYTINANTKLTFEVSVKFNNIGNSCYTVESVLEGWSYK